MKKLVCSLAALFAFGMANAQETTITSEGFKQGDAFISGSVGFSNQKNGDFKTNTFNVSPKAAYFVSNNIALGVSLGYNAIKQDNFDNGYYTQKNHSFNAGVFGRYYFTPANKFSFFAQLGADYFTTKTEVAVYNSETTVNGFNIQLAPAISYFVSNHFALEATFGILGYNTRKPNDDFGGNNSTNTFNFGLNLSNINFGAVYKF